MSKKVACGNFVKRQTEDSGHSHFDGDWEELEKYCDLILDTPLLASQLIRPGYRDGVVLLDLDRMAFRFRSAIIDLTGDTKLRANYAPRRPEEAPFIRLSAKAEKQVAKHVSIVLYRHDVLAENNERETDAEWEIVCIKARTSEEEEPMDPYTMARNFLHLKGGTKGDFSAEDFAKSIIYWNNHVMCAAKPKWYRKLLKWVRS
jgi:Protein of unknown function (DUF3228)